MKKKVKKSKKQAKALKSLPQEKYVRSTRKTVYFNDPEMKLINAFCDKYHVRSKSALFRRLIIDQISIRLDESSRLF